jgi:hypothetical protein
VLSTNAAGGNYQIDFFTPEIKAPSAPVVVVPIAVANLTAQTANIAPTTLSTPSANGLYRVSCFLVETTAAATTSTLPLCQVNWTDADSSIAENVAVTAINSGNANGIVGLTPAVNAPFPYFFAKSGVAITFQTTSYASNPASAMVYAVRVRLEGPF